jgi:VWFA-related protein
MFAPSSSSSNPRRRAGRGAPALMLGACIVATVGGARGTAAQAARDGATFPAQAELVVVDAVVLDQHGAPVPDLKAADFTLLEDGQPRDITSFEAFAVEDAESPNVAPARTRVASNAPAVPAGRSFVVVFDDVHVTPRTARRAQDAVRRFIETGLRPGDELTLVTTSTGAWWTARMPEQREDALRVLARIESRRWRESGPEWITDTEATWAALERDDAMLGFLYSRWQSSGLVPVRKRASPGTPGPPMIQAKAELVYADATQRLRVTLQTLERVVAALAVGHGRKNVLLISEGFVLERTRGEARSLQRAAQAANVVLHFVDSRGLEESGPSFEAAELETAVHRPTYAYEAAGAQQVALDSGGEVVTHTEDLAGAMRRIAEQSRAYYLLGYVPAATRDGRFHRIDVRVARPDAQVRARRGYLARTAGQHGPGRDEAAQAAVRAALDAPFASSGLELRLMSYVFGPAAGGKVRTLLLGETPLAGLGSEGGDGKVDLDVFVALTARDSGASLSDGSRVELRLKPDERRRLEASGLPVGREVLLAPGTYQARLVVRDARSRRHGSVRHEFTVEPPTAWHTSTPILTDSVEVDAGGPPRPIPVARRSFKPAGRLYCAYEVYGAARGSGGQPEVEAGFELRRGTGTVVAAMASRAIRPTPDGRLSQLLALSLEGAEPGEYELRLDLRDRAAARTLEVAESFAVVP